MDELAGRRLNAETLRLRRSFLRLREGLMHYRHAGDAIPTVWLMHASPASSASLEGLTAELGRACRAIAPDTPGYGDSAGLGVAQPTLGDYAEAQFRMMDALEVERAVLYGHHTGAHIAVEMAIAAPERIAGLMLEGLLWLQRSERDEYLREYAPPMPPDAWGTQAFQALQWLRDQAWFFPHFRRDEAHNLGGGAMPPALLHALLIDMLKAGPGYRDAYQAVFRQQLEERLPLIDAPVLLMAAPGDPTSPGLDCAAACLSRSARCDLPDGWSGEALRRKAALIVEFAAAAR